MHGSPPPRGSAARRGKSPRLRTDGSVVSSPAPEFSGKSTATFTSCLSIAVDGAVPVERLDPSPDINNDTSVHPQGSETKRAPRKSKTDALAALHHHARSASLGQEDLPDGMMDEAGINIQLREGSPIHVSPTLDISSVKTPNPRATPSRPASRPFGLSDCPTYHPTVEQFKDPLAYIQSIAETAREFGMCKIVPPQGWNMPFVTDTERFRFKTRLQRLNSIEASSRAKVNFLEQLYRFHKQQGNPRVSVPTINHKPLDLWLLRKEVQKLGGHEAVTRGKKWADLGRILGYSGIPGLSTQIKNSYNRVILPYEHFCDRVRNSPTMAPQKPRDSQLKTHVNIQSAGSHRRLSTSVNGDDSPPSSPLTTTSSPLSEVPDEGEYKNANGKDARARRNLRRNSREQSISGRGASVSLDAVPPSELKEGQPPTEPHCEVCHKKNRGEEMLLCDGCDCGFHIFCLDPPLSSIPKGKWFCHTCLFGTGGDFGFDEGEEHSLSSFQARDLEFRKLWFKSHPPAAAGEHGEISAKGKSNDPAMNLFGDIVVTETDVENEFWRLVQSPTETVEVEYGADVHSTTHGSAMPTLETHPLDPYSKDPWNLNNIPISPESLLRFIKSDISGMTVPWTYVGMVFSTFCWHNEDHYTYSLNYMHWGETKTWYSIPGRDADKFEEAIRREAPDLFEAQPDLLFQLVTLMNPERIKASGVDVYACNQRAGEFVITFPKAYHAGFNHGLNFNEAVNFALPDWLPFGLDCMKRYQEHRKQPVFSHDELLITITQQSQSISTALWLNDSLQEMMDREMQVRSDARSLQMEEALEESDRPEDQYQCHVCKTFCYLSQISCSCTTKVVCIDHVDLLCKCAKSRHVLRKRFSDTELHDIQAKVSERAAIPAVWRGKLSKLLTESGRPSLRSLRALLAESDRIVYPLEEVAALRKCVTRANEWVEAANAFIIRKPSRKRARKSRGRPSGAAENGSVEDVMEKPDQGLDDLYALLREVDKLGFECAEIQQLRNIVNDAETTKQQARALLEAVTTPRDRDAHIQECERLILHGSSLNVHLEEIVEVEKIVLREQLLKELEEDADDERLSLEDVRQLVLRGRACSLSLDNRYMKLIEARLHAGENWEARVKAVLDRPQRTLPELESVWMPGSGVPIDRDLLDRVVASRNKGKEIEKQAKAWLAPDANAQKPRVQEALKLIARSEKEFDIPTILDLKRTADFALDLETRCDEVLRNVYVHAETDDIFKVMCQWRTYAKEHLTMFSLPHFEKLDKQLNQHFRWLEGLPWFCRQHGHPHGKPILDDVVESTRPEDDLPPGDEYFTCICTTPVRPPAPGTVSDAVQCDHCFARFHGVCALNGGSCPFCDHHHWNGTIHKERSWHSCYLPTILLRAPDVTKHYSEDWKQLEIIVHRIDRLSTVIGQFLAFASQPANQRVEYIPQVRHYMRKLYKIQFAVSPNPEVSFGLDLAGLHRILAGQPAPIRMKKRRRPKFVFGQDVDKDWHDGTRCICRGRTNYLLNYPTVECELCQKLYHAGCVFFPIDSTPGAINRFMCPLCCLRKNRSYRYSDVRVKHIDNLDFDTYVDTKEMLDTFSKDIVYIHLPPPFVQTLFVELIRFTPGQPDNMAASVSTGPSRVTPVGNGPPMLANGSSSHERAIHSNSAPPPHHGHHHHSHNNHHGPPQMPQPVSPAAVAPFDVARGSAGSAHHIPPPPPWSRWSSAAAAAPPPRTLPGVDALASPIELPAQPNRKRKYSDDGPPPEEPFASTSSPNNPSPKRRPQSQASTSQGPPSSVIRTNQNQGMSPSLAMMLSPTSADLRSPTRQPPQAYQSRSMMPSPSSRMPDPRDARAPEELPSPHARGPAGPQKVKLVYNARHDDSTWTQGAGPSSTHDVHPSPRR